MVFLRLASIKDEASTPQFRESTAKRTGSSKKFVAIVSNPEINKPTPITGNETLEDAFKLDSQQNYTISFQIYRHLARQGEVIAQFNLGVMYANGQGIAQNDKHAVYCYQKAAEQGYAKAQNNFGWMYGKDRGLEQDYKQAVFWYRKATEQGSADAQKILTKRGINWKCA